MATITPNYLTQATELLKQLTQLRASMLQHIDQCNPPKLQELNTLHEKIHILANHILTNPELKSTLLYCHWIVESIVLSHKEAAHLDSISNVTRVFRSISL